MANYFRTSGRLASRKVGFALALALFVVLGGNPADAKSRRSKISEEDTGVSAAQLDTGSRKTRKLTLSLREMGAWGNIRLQGVDGQRSLSFPIRTDEVVVGAKLRIAYDYSPALLPDLSHLIVSFNDRTASVVPLPRDKPVGNVRDIDLDPRLFRDLNSLDFKFIGHYSPRCDDPHHSSLWLVLSELGRLELTLAPVAQSIDLRKLPNPFFDPREQTQISVQFVFPRNPGQANLQAGGIVASWFGMQVLNRGVQFPVSYGELPEGHAVVFLQGSDSVGGVRASEQASLRLIPHPSDPRSRLLVVSGRDEPELLRAARALAIGSSTLAGSQVLVSKDPEATPRKPYDAPAWLRTDRPVHFGELAPASAMRVHAYSPDAIRINYRVSPDTFVWHSEGVPVDLRLRATRLPSHRNSSLNIGLNSAYLQTLALNAPLLPGQDPAAQGASQVEGPAVRQQWLRLPPAPIQGRDQLQLTYTFDVNRQGDCLVLPPDNLEASIEPDSTLDFSSFPHYAAMPNLAYFATLGYPYTRLADLSETAVVLSDTPTSDEVALYLAIMGRMGESTGYPVLRHSLVTVEQIDKVASKDLIVVQSASNQSLMSKWKDAMPMVVTDGERRLREPRGSLRLGYQWAQEDLLMPRTPPGSMALISNDGLSTIMGFESPLSSGRSVVFFYADKSNHLRKIVDLLTDFDRLPSVQGDFVVVDDKSIQHARVADTYYLGSLPWSRKLRWFLADQPLVFGLLAVFVALLAGVLAYRPLQRWRERRKPQ